MTGVEDTIQTVTVPISDALNTSVPDRLRTLVTLLEETCHWERNLTMPSFAPLPVCSLAFVSEVEDVSSWLPALAICYLASLAIETISPNRLFFSLTCLGCGIIPQQQKSN